MLMNDGEHSDALIRQVEVHGVGEAFHKRTFGAVAHGREGVRSISDELCDFGNRVHEQQAEADFLLFIPSRGST